MKLSLKSLVGLAALTIAADARGQLPADFDRVLLPIYVQHAPGGGGSHWSTLFSVFLRDRNVDIPLPQECGFTCPTHSELVAGQMNFPGLVYCLAHHPGRVFLAPAGTTDSMDFHLRVFNEANTSSPGVELPVVRERDLYNRPIHLIAIPLPHDFVFGLRDLRYNLRVYALDPQGWSEVVVRVYFGPDLLLERTLSLLVANPFIPGFASISDLLLFLPGGEAGQFRIEVTPTVEGQRIWAFVTVTSTPTNEILTITPK